MLVNFFHIIYEWCSWHFSVWQVSSICWWFKKILNELVNSSLDASNLQRDLDTLLSWCQQNGLDLYINKCICMPSQSFKKSLFNRCNSHRERFVICVFFIIKKLHLLSSSLNFHLFLSLIFHNLIIDNKTFQLKPIIFVAFKWSC